MTQNYIFLAEDDEDDQELIRMAFSEITADHKFEIVNNGQQLLEALHAQGDLPCLIILDLNMPILNGIQTLIELRREPRFEKVPKVILTTSENEVSKSRSFSNGAIDYFVKPSNMKEFVKTAEKMLTYCQ